MSFFVIFFCILWSLKSFFECWSCRCRHSCMWPSPIERCWGRYLVVSYQYRVSCFIVPFFHVPEIWSEMCVFVFVVWPGARLLIIGSPVSRKRILCCPLNGTCSWSRSIIYRIQVRVVLLVGQDCLRLPGEVCHKLSEWLVPSLSLSLSCARAFSCFFKAMTATWRSAFHCRWIPSCLLASVKALGRWQQLTDPSLVGALLLPAVTW